MSDCRVILAIILGPVALAVYQWRNRNRPFWYRGCGEDPPRAT